MPDPTGLDGRYQACEKSGRRRGERGISEMGLSIPANANGKCPFLPDAALGDGHFPPEVAARPVENLMAVAVLDGVKAIVRVAVYAVVRMGDARHVGTDPATRSKRGVFSPNVSHCKTLSWYWRASPFGRRWARYVPR